VKTSVKKENDHPSLPYANTPFHKKVREGEGGGERVAKARER
jgi:hypothetical protein